MPQLFVPFDSDCAEYGIVRVPKLASFTDTVMLRVFGELTNVPDADSLVDFAYEFLDGGYESAVDSTILNPNQQQMQMMMVDELEASGPYPNPSNKNVDNTSILVNLDELDEDIQVSVWTQGGIQVGSSHTAKSKRQWQKIKVKTPSQSGTYYIRIQANGKQVVLPMVVTN